VNEGRRLPRRRNKGGTASRQEEQQWPWFDSIRFVTLGLFYLVINGAAFGLAAWMVPGFHVASWTAAILGALLTSLVSWFLGIFVRRD
jgi:hypothetical protein